MVDHADVACNLPQRAHELVAESVRIESSCQLALFDGNHAHGGDTE